MHVIEKTYPFNYHEAYHKLKQVVLHTPLQYNPVLSKQYQCNIYLKREDLQIVRSYKLRGAFNLLNSLSETQLKKGVVCASAGNHAQGFAYSCKYLGIKGIVFMPIITPKQKINQTKMFGEDAIEIKLTGDTFDDCALAAQQFTLKNEMTFIPPFDDLKVIEGQSTVGIEILESLSHIDYLFMPIGGGGLAAGVGSYFKQNAPNTQLIGVEPEGAPSMYKAFEAGEPIMLQKIDRFVDGAAVKKVGSLTYPICKEILNNICLVPEGKVCTTILNLYNQNAIVAEPAGALSIAALEQYATPIKNKTVVCIVSGGNNDIDRMPEIKERSLQYEGLKHYFLIQFAQRPGALREFLNKVLGPDNDITRFGYMQKTNKETGPALVGIELTDRNDYAPLLTRMQHNYINFTEINKQDTLYSYLI
ncbi:threonine ammonia-lyase [Hydrotalea sp.]|uniref:threonine ammonia-lyase n=1 Tax=Hydrotalea sp. TaxID=2881279 RepID=UPI00263A08F0|nr:threonine ammonia-lyase [Hydrotalea sp.]